MNRWNDLLVRRFATTSVIVNFDVEKHLLNGVLESADCKLDPETNWSVKVFEVWKININYTVLQEKLQQYVRSRLSKHAYPKEIEFVSSLPKTSSGKIQCNLLKQQEIAKQDVFEKVS